MSVVKVNVFHNRLDDKVIRVYVKSYCPFCIKLLKLLDDKRIKYEKVDVIADKEMYKQMQKKSGQNGVPQVEMMGIIIPDYSNEEDLVAEVERMMKSK